MNSHFLVHRLCCWHDNRPGSRATPRARELLCVLKLCVTFKLIPSHLQSIIRSFAILIVPFLATSCFDENLDNFSLTYKFREELHKGTSNGPSVCLFFPTPTHTKANLVSFRFLSFFEGRQFLSNLVTLFCSWLLD